eukprot:Seg2779.2 transcript_id=Seg2779.2/GoldUCD/mRNA.D3Y31 product="hypothetical protein" protein_id=Seg2779.2/GoldUCD/D3Y31
MECVENVNGRYDEHADFLMDNVVKETPRLRRSEISQLASSPTNRGNQQQQGCLVPSTPFGNQAPRKRLLREMSEPSSINDSMVDVTGIEKHDSLTETATWILTQNNTDTMLQYNPDTIQSNTIQYKQIQYNLRV